MFSVTSASAFEKLHYGQKYNLYSIGNSLMVGLSSATNMPAIFTNWDGAPRFMGRMTNAAISGDFITNMVTRARTGMTPFRAAGGTNLIVFIEGGTNDKGTSGTDLYPTNIIFEAITNLAYMAETNGATQIVMFNLLPRLAWGGTPQQASWTNLNNMITTYAATKTNVLLVPWNTMFTTNDLPDGTHLSELGQEISAGFIATNLFPIGGNFQASANTITVRR